MLTYDDIHKAVCEIAPNMIIVAGHLCLDISPALNTPAEALLPGRLIETGEARFVPGGAVGNCGSALKALGADVRAMSLIGTDEIGGMLYSIMDRRGLAAGLARTDKAATSYTFVIAPPDTDRIFLHHPGLNETIGPDDMDIDAASGARLFHFGYPTLMRRFYADGGDGLANMYKTISNGGALTSLDLSLYGDGTPAASAPWREILAKTLPYVDFFVPSAEELCKMLDPGRLEDWGVRAPDIPADVEPLADMAIELGARVVMIKCGERGLFLKCAGRAAMAGRPDPMREFVGVSLYQPALRPPRPVVSAAGAGDMCISAFLYAAVQGYAPERCLRLGAAAGSLSVTEYDGAAALVPLEELEKAFF